MRIGYKLVAAGLMLIALLAPSASLAFCAPVSAKSAAPMQCSPDCPMMTAMQAATGGVNVNAAPQRSSCCEMSSGLPAPTSESQVPATTFSIAPPLVDHATAIASVTSSEVTDLSAPPPLSFSQAVLCTFLI